MTLLILGAGGQVGRALAERAGHCAIPLDRADCDVTDPESVGDALARRDISIVVNCAGYTTVDCAESEPEQAFALNAQAVAVIGRRAAARGFPVIHLSTDYVYDGSGESPLTEMTAVAPLNVYGASKAAGDKALAEVNRAHLILRVSWVFGAYGTNFVKTMLRLGRTRDEMRIIADQIGGPTEAGDIADAILTVATACRKPGFTQWGIYHFCGSPVTSWHGFAQAIFARAPFPAPRLVPIASEDYPSPARRPRNSRLDCSKIARVFGLAQPDWRAALSRVMEQFERSG